MSKEQIENLAKKLKAYCHDIELNDIDDCRRLSDFIIDTLGYRKQSEGEWIEHIEKPSWLEDDVEVYYNCSVCGTSHWSITPPFCPNCGARMKGGAG